MSAGYLPAPGEKYGPCEAACAHVDCAATRAMAAQTCRLCAQLIGAPTWFYDDDEVTVADLAASRHPIVHARCLEMQAAKARGAK